MLYKLIFSSITTLLILEMSNLLEIQAEHKNTLINKFCIASLKSKLDFNAMIELRLARKGELVKILGRGELKAKLKISAHKFTENAKAAIEAVGGESITL